MRANFLQILESQSCINGRYVNLRRIGHAGGDGSFSILCSAEELSTGKRVALKFFDPTQSQDAYRVACFERESQVLKSLSGQEHVLQLVAEANDFIYSITDPNTGLPFQFRFRFFATELAQSSVFDSLYQGKLGSALKSLDVFRSICKGLRRIHANRICHRDLKPANCLMLDKKLVKISDFGTAKSLDGTIASPPTIYSIPVGDIRYSAPELLCGLDGGATFQYEADMYSLGAILYELFAMAPLGSVLQNSINTLVTSFMIIGNQDKKRVFDGIISTMHSQVTLPNIWNSVHPDRVPSCIVERLNQLYKNLACWDYRKRLTSWESVFNQLSIINIRLRKDIELRRNLEYRKSIRLKRRSNNTTLRAQA